MPGNRFWAQIASNKYVDILNFACSFLGGFWALATWSFKLWANDLTSWMSYHHSSTGPVRLPTLQERFLCSLDHIFYKQIWSRTGKPSWGICLVNMSGCLSKLSCLFHPVLDNIFSLHIVIGGMKKCVHALHWLGQVIHFLKVICLEGAKLSPIGTAQCHSHFICVWDNPTNDAFTWEAWLSACNLL